jgi:sporulation protein YlmC with PRC-barrel domain
MTHPIYFEDEYGHHVYTSNGKVLTDIKSVMINGVLCDVTGRSVEVTVMEMGHRNTFKTKRYFVNYGGVTAGLDEFVWFDPDDEWFEDEGEAEYEVLAVEVE